MAKTHGNSIKNDKNYEALRDKGYSTERSAKIANSGKSSSRKGGKHSHSRMSDWSRTDQPCRILSPHT
jgi:hypothetical protein